MTRLTQSDVSRLLTAVQELHRHTDFSSFPNLLIEVQSKLVPCEISTYSLIDKQSGQMQSVHDYKGGDSEKLFPAFAAHYHEHPLPKHCAKAKDGKTTKTSDLLTLKQFKRLGIYNEFYRHFGVQYQLVFYLFQTAGLELGMGAQRSFKDFSERDRTMLDLISPHFALAYRNASAFTNLNRLLDRSGEVLDASSQGMVFLAGDLHIERMTGRCEPWLKKYFSWDEGSRTALPETLLRWILRQRSQQRSEAALANPPAPLVIEHASASLVVRYAPHPVNGATLLLSEQRRLQADSFTGFGLTPREREVSLWISEGKSNPEIGRILGISARTVDKHVERVLAKMNVESRRAVMLKVLSRTA